jgi:hypothetical protein
MLVTTVFEERGGRTTVTATVLYSSIEARDNALKTPMIEGWSQGIDRLDELLAKPADGERFKWAIVPADRSDRHAQP